MFGMPGVGFGLPLAMRRSHQEMTQADTYCGFEFRPVLGGAYLELYAGWSEFLYCEMPDAVCAASRKRFTRPHPETRTLHP